MIYSFGSKIAEIKEHFKCKSFIKLPKIAMIVSTTPTKMDATSRYGEAEIKSRTTYCNALATENVEYKSYTNDYMGKIESHRNFYQADALHEDSNVSYMNRRGRDAVLPAESSFLSPASTTFRLSPRFRKLQAEAQAEETAVKTLFHRTDNMQEMDRCGRDHRKPIIFISGTNYVQRPESWNQWLPGPGNESWRRHFRPSTNIASSEGEDTVDGPGATRRLQMQGTSKTNTRDNHIRYPEGTFMHRTSQSQTESIQSYADDIRSQQWKGRECSREFVPNHDRGQYVVSIPYAKHCHASERNISNRGRHQILLRRSIVQQAQYENHARWTRPTSFISATNDCRQHKQGRTEEYNGLVKPTHIEPTESYGKIEHKRSKSPIMTTQVSIHDSDSNPFKKAKGFDKLDLLCSATLDMGELYDNPTGCSCPKSKCIALYCDCFKAGRRCNPDKCKCLDCKNTVTESGEGGARTKAIRSILARNPRAFTTAGLGNPILKLPPGEIACNCVRSRCLKLYCSCFQNGKACDPKICTCAGCYNTKSDDDGHRSGAMQQYLEKRPDAFHGKKQKEVGLGCACKNNRCIRKYCECFRSNLVCTDKCSCRQCENEKGSLSQPDEI